MVVPAGQHPGLDGIEIARARSCPSCRSIGAPKDGCMDLWHVEVRRPVGASPARPVYSKIAESDSGATARFMIVCDEGWRSSIVCEGMYGDAADWLLGILGHRPFRTGH